MRKPFFITLITFVIIGTLASVAILLAKGYRLSTQDKTFFGTGILSLTSSPDQASVYLDGHLTTATNANVNSLEPKIYEVKIIKDGFIPWQKKVEVKEGLVTEVKATLFPAIPSIYPLTFNGVSTLTPSLDNLRFAFIVPTEGEQTSPILRRSGVWVWDMSSQPVQFARGREPHQILTGLSAEELSEGTIQWSPDSAQIIFTFGERNLLLETNKLNDNPRDVTPILKATLRGWEQERAASELARVQTLKDATLKNIASSSAMLKWSPDDTKFLYSLNGKDQFKVVDLIERKTFDLDLKPGPDGKLAVNWLADSRHLVLTENNFEISADKAEICPKEEVVKSQECKIFPGTISVIEYDGTNKSAFYAGQFDPNSVFPWADGTRVIMVSSIPTPTASEPNLFGINLK